MHVLLCINLGNSKLQDPFFDALGVGPSLVQVGQVCFQNIGDDGAVGGLEVFKEGVSDGLNISLPDVAEWRPGAGI
jgi:hypothetical protein